VKTQVEYAISFMVFLFGTISLIPLTFDAILDFPCTCRAEVPLILMVIWFALGIGAVFFAGRLLDEKEGRE
jgi:hypothetical protein